MKALKIGNLLATVPIVQGGMGVGISLSGLASAVANQGGVGVISSAGLGAIYNNYSKDYRAASIWGLKEELRKAREATRGIVGVNVMVAMSNFADMVKTAVAEKADIIFSGARLPLNLPSSLTERAKTTLAPIVSSANGPRRTVTSDTRRSSSPTSIFRSKPSFPKSSPRCALSVPNTTAIFPSSRAAASIPARISTASCSWAPTACRWARAS